MNAHGLKTYSVILALALTLGGCQKYRAENSLKKTRQLIGEIEQKYDGNAHKPEELNSLKNSVEQALNLLASDPSGALSSAGAARASADDLLEQVRQAQAGALVKRAKDEIEVFRVNNLHTLDPTRWQRIEEILADAEEAQTNNKWDEMIKFSTEIVTEVGRGLEPLKRNADSAKDAAKSIETQMLQASGQIYAPTFVIETQNLIREGDDQYTRRDYNFAQTKFESAKAKGQEGINKVREEKAREVLERIETAMGTALIEGADVFKPNEYKAAVSLFEKMTENFNNRAFDDVISGADILSRQADLLVTETKRAASDDRINNLTVSIRELEEGRIVEYIPEALTNLKASLAKMQQTRVGDNNESFDEIKAVFVLAADELDKVRGSFEQLAADRIRDSKGKLGTTRGVFEEMQSIFDPIEGVPDSDAQVFESQKRTRQEQLRGQLTEADERLVVAEFRLQDDKFHEAIVLAAEVGTLADQMLNNIYHVVAHNAAIELARLVSRFEREGARQYAAEELTRSTGKTEDVKKLIREEKFREAVNRAAEARADVELMAQRIAGRATEDLKEAEEALSIASSEKTRKFRADMLDQVRTRIETARKDLQENRLGLAVENANQAILAARQAEKEANQLSADEAIAAAAAALTEAQNAGAELYAGREVEDARKLLASARSLYASQDFQKADELAQSSAGRARAGLFKKINEADAEVANAQAVGGWEFSDSRLARANTDAREARLLMEQRNYNASRSKAESAAAGAKSLTNDTKNSNVSRQIARLRGNLNDGTKQGVNFFQPEDSIEIRRELARLENMYVLDNYELTMVELQKIEGRLRGTLDGTDKLVETVAAQQGRRLDFLVEEGAAQFASVQIKEAKDGLRFALLDYERGLYKSAHSNLDRAIKMIDEIELRRSQENYSRAVEELFFEYRQLQVAFDNILSLEPQELKALAVGTNGAAQSVAITAQVTNAEFRKTIDELYGRALVIKAPEGLKPVHEGVLKAFTEGRIAALNFEKLAILSSVSVGEAHLLIDQAFIRMNNSNLLISKVQNQLISDEVRFRLVNNQTGRLVN